MRSFGAVRRMTPTSEQSVGLMRAVGACRFAQNVLLAAVKRSMATDQDMSWTSISLHTEWRRIRVDVAPWFTEISKDAFQSGADRLSRALFAWHDGLTGHRAGRRIDFPKFRKRGKNDSVTFTNGKLRSCGSQVRIPRIGDVALAEGVELGQGQRVTSITVRYLAGRWFVTFLIREDAWSKPEPRWGSTVGIDLGIGARFATLSTGEITENPRWFRRDEDRLSHAQKAVARKQKGSRNQRKARLRASRVAYQTGCRRRDFIHKFTTKLSKTHARIVVEDLDLIGMSQRSGYRLGKSVRDAALSEVRRQLEYKSSWYGAELIIADRWFPSSKMCSACGAINSNLKLSDRTWQCSCGVSHDRDLNAAMNLESLAGSSLVTACGDDVRPERALAVVSEAGSGEEILHLIA